MSSPEAVVQQPEVRRENKQKNYYTLVFQPKDRRDFCDYSNTDNQYLVFACLLLVEHNGRLEARLIGGDSDHANPIFNIRENTMRQAGVFPIPKSEKEVAPDIYTANLFPHERGGTPYDDGKNIRGYLNLTTQQLKTLFSEPFSISITQGDDIKEVHLSDFLCSEDKKEVRDSLLARHKLEELRQRIKFLIRVFPNEKNEFIRQYEYILSFYDKLKENDNSFFEKYEEFEKETWNKKNGIYEFGGEGGEFLEVIDYLNTAETLENLSSSTDNEVGSGAGVPNALLQIVALEAERLSTGGFSREEWIKIAKNPVGRWLVLFYIELAKEIEEKKSDYLIFDDTHIFDRAIKIISKKAHDSYNPQLDNKGDMVVHGLSVDAYLEDLLSIIHNSREHQQYSFINNPSRKELDSIPNATGDFIDLLIKLSLGKFEDIDFEELKRKYKLSEIDKIRARFEAQRKLILMFLLADISKVSGYFLKVSGYRSDTSKHHLDGLSVPENFSVEFNIRQKHLHSFLRASITADRTVGSVKYYSEQAKKGYFDPGESFNDFVGVAIIIDRKGEPGCVYTEDGFVQDRVFFEEKVKLPDGTCVPRLSFKNGQERVPKIIADFLKEKISFYEKKGEVVVIEKFMPPPENGEKFSVNSPGSGANLYFGKFIMKVWKKKQLKDGKNFFVCIPTEYQFFLPKNEKNGSDFYREKEKDQRRYEIERLQGVGLNGPPVLTRLFPPRIYPPVKVNK